MEAVRIFGGLYEVRADGSVYSLRSERLLKPIMQKNGYVHVTLRDSVASKQASVHVLVAEAFLGPRPEGMVVNHKNALRTDNRLENLEWVTQSENVRHAYRLGRRTINEAHVERCAELGRAKRKTTASDEALIRSMFSGRRGDLERIAQRSGFSRYVVARVLQEGGRQ